VPTRQLLEVTDYSQSACVFTAYWTDSRLTYSSSQVRNPHTSSQHVGLAADHNFTSTLPKFQWTTIPSGPTKALTENEMVG
jgi:hypothetical protein